MAQQEGGPGQRLKTTLQTRRNVLGWTQEKLGIEAEVSRQTIIRLESGNASNPEGETLRKVCMAMKLDVREVLIDLGYITREEFGLPPKEPPLPRTLLRIVQLLQAEQVPDKAKQRLLDLIDTALDFWFQQFGIKDFREPSHEERSQGKSVAPKR